MEATQTERQENRATIEAIPATHISDAERAAYLARADDGEDVRAYGHERLLTDNFVNIWDTDQRIAHGPLATRWYIRSAYHDTTRWAVTIVSPDEQYHPQESIHIDIAYPYTAPYKQHTTLVDYETYAQRVLLSLVNHCSAFNLDPVAQLNNSHH